MQLCLLSFILDVLLLAHRLDAPFQCSLREAQSVHVHVPKQLVGIVLEFEGERQRRAFQGGCSEDQSIGSLFHLKMEVRTAVQTLRLHEQLPDMGRVDQTDGQTVVGAVLLEFCFYDACTFGAENEFQLLVLQGEEFFLCRCLHLRIEQAGFLTQLQLLQRITDGDLPSDGLLCRAFFLLRSWSHLLCGRWFGRCLRSEIIIVADQDQSDQHETYDGIEIWFSHVLFLLNSPSFCAAMRL